MDWGRVPGLAEMLPPVPMFGEHSPLNQNVLKALMVTPLKNVRCVLVAKYPYPDPTYATFGPDDFFVYEQAAPRGFASLLDDVADGALDGPNATASLGGGRLVLNASVASVAHSCDGVRVRARDGREWRARHVATSPRAASPLLRALCGRSHDGTDDSPHAPNRAAALSARSLSSPVSSFASTETTDSSSGNVCTDRLWVWPKCRARYWSRAASARPRTRPTLKSCGGSEVLVRVIL